MKVLRKILEKVFSTKKFTQCKTSCTLQIVVFEISDNKNIGKLFWKYKLHFLDQAFCSFNPSQIMILQFPITRASLPPSPPLSYLTLASQLKPLSFNTILIILFIDFPIFPTPFDQMLSQVLDKLNSMSSPANQIFIKLVFKSHFSFKLRQHCQQQLYLHYKVCWVLYKIVDAPSFSQP